MAAQREREAMIPTPDGYSVSISTCSDDPSCVQLTVDTLEPVLLPVSEFLAAQRYVREPTTNE